MEEAATPKSKKATIEWLRQKLDQIETERMHQERVIKSLREDLLLEREAVHHLRADAEMWKKKWSEAQAWSDIHMEQTDASIKELHRIYTMWNMERES